MNLLSKETSPYLLQHANNPVHWKAWNTVSLAEAKQQNKLMLISVGYAACHWCHVMEHECFEDEETAQLMNAHFINIKVDREERPDVDAVYMKALQLLTRGCGWPMNIVALPDGRPIWGGTYFKKEEWMHSLRQLQEVYQSEPDKVINYAEKLHEGIQYIDSFPNATTAITIDLDSLVDKWKDDFDYNFGGLSGVPKFMMPNNYLFLMRYAFQKKDQTTADFVNLTLSRMAQGGIFDTVGGGFSRYSVDTKWHIPHFEKMLYDNGQMVSLYSQAYKWTSDALYKEVIEKTLSFVENEFMNPDGGFYCSLDADSLNADNKQKEGAFYVWNETELKTVLGEDFELFSQVFNINPFGIWEDGNYVLIQNKSLEVLAEQHNMKLSRLQEKKAFWERILYIKREKRSKPRLDDKCLTSWNAIMLKGYVDAYKAMKEPKYLDIALKNAQFIIEKMGSSEGHLFHNYKDEKSTLNGYLEDYCFVIDAFICLYEVTLDEKWLLDAKQLTDYSLEHFYDDKNGLFSFSSRLDAALITQHYETEDNVIPASNSVMAKNLYLLSIYFEEVRYRDLSHSMLQNIWLSIEQPSAYSNWMDLAMNFASENIELALCGDLVLKKAKKINALYLPHLVLAGTLKEPNIPFLKNRFKDGETLFYLCQNKSCSSPTANWQEIISKLI